MTRKPDPWQSALQVCLTMAHPLSRQQRPAAQLMIGATGQGLVAFDAQGEIEPALAERWIVEDEGKSYIFRLRKATWPDGEKITAEQVARILSSRVKVSARSSLRPDLQSVSEILAMTGEVRSEEHTSELQSLMRISYAVFCLKKKT